jgi:beta-galactosidase
LIAQFDAVPYEPGELKAVAYDGGAVTATRLLRTTGAPAALRLTPDRAQLQAGLRHGTADLSYVMVEVVDAHGQVVPNADPLLQFSLSGPGEIIAVGSGNPTTTEPYVGSQRKAFRGRALVVVKASGQAGTINLAAAADGMPMTSAQIQVG